MASDSWDLVVVGGGAAGFFAALACAEYSPHPPRILIVEKSNRPLGKVLVSGGGRCNLTHACYDPARLSEFYPRGGVALRSAFSRFQPRDTVAWFENHGVRLKTEADGCIFPVSDTAQTILDCLLQAAQQTGVQLGTQQTVIAVEADRDGFRLHLQPSGQAESITLTTRRVLLATGGDSASLRLAEGLGHTVEPPVPSLFTFTVPDHRLAGLAGISVLRAGLTLLDDGGGIPRLAGMVQAGPLLITHWGLSGPAVLRLSAWGARWLHGNDYRAGLAVNWLDVLTPDAGLIDLLAYKTTPAHVRQKPALRCPFDSLPLRLWQHLVEAAGITAGQNWADLSKLVLRRLADELTQGRYAIQGKGPFKEEFVTCGGVRLDEVDFKTMESRLLPGLYFAGEALDVDGLTGGFNFQNAWSTGWLAGRAISRRLGNR
jgi:predicted Rossmann fold flavoprotein